jgi:hypothetical protein
MSDVALANVFIEEIGGTNKVKVMLASATKFLRENFRHGDEPEKQWTERRLRSWWNNESRKVEFWQMVELATAAELAKIKREESRRESSQLRARLATLDARLATVDPDFHRETLAAIRSQTRKQGSQAR